MFWISRNSSIYSAMEKVTPHRSLLYLSMEHHLRANPHRSEQMWWPGPDHNNFWIFYLDTPTMSILTRALASDTKFFIAGLVRKNRRAKALIITVFGNVKSMSNAQNSSRVLCFTFIKLCSFV